MNDKLDIATLRCMSLDMIDRAKAGHPGMSLGSAAILHTLYTRHLVASPSNPNWIKRDRFVMSAGHASALLYSLLHVAGYNLSIDDLKDYKVLKSKTPGHPELGVTDGVDISTGPLGQGISNAVGFAIAERHLCSLYPDLSNLLSHYTYALCGDGCLEEGLGQEALSLAGNLKLSKLIILYDNNDVTLDGPLAQSSSDDMENKVKAMGFNVITVKDGNDVDAIDNAIIKAKSQNEKPTMIIVKTIIGYGAKNQGDHSVHGAPLGKEGSLYAKVSYGWDYPEFYVPESVYDDYKESFIKRGNEFYDKFEKELQLLSSDNRKIYEKIIKNDVDVDTSKFVYENGYSNATRNVSGELLNYYSTNSDNLIGGSADVAGSVKTGLKDKKTFNASSYDGQNINFGIREHAMCAIANGIAAHGGLRPYVGSFLVFSDYAKGAMRMSSMMKLPVVYLFSHDSIAVGSDGPTHQPIEQIASLRLIPNFNVIRPADAREVVGAYNCAFSLKSIPTAIILSRQNLITENGSSDILVSKGAYIIAKESKKLDAIILATGSEVNLACRAKEELAKDNIDVRVVSMPSKFMFEKQSQEYIDSVLPNRDITIAVEMGVGDLWYKYASKVMSVDKFGLSCPADDVINEYGFTVDNLVSKVKSIL